MPSVRREMHTRSLVLSLFSRFLAVAAVDVPAAAAATGLQGDPHAATQQQQQHCTGVCDSRSADRIFRSFTLDRRVDVSPLPLSLSPSSPRFPLPTPPPDPSPAAMDRSRGPSVRGHPCPGAGGVDSMQAATAGSAPDSSCKCPQSVGLMTGRASCHVSLSLFSCRC